MTLLDVQALRVGFENSAGLKALAVDNISFSISSGEILCLVGESGCGKSISSLSLLRLEPEGAEIVSGQALFHGQDLLSMPKKKLRQIRGNAISMIFQDPMASLNPVMKIGSQMSEALRLHKGYSAQEALERCIELLDKVGIPDPKERINAYPHELSGGMRQRVIIAQALSCTPELIIADEPTTALDVTVQRQILLLLHKLVKEAESGLLLISHDLAVVAACADTVAVMYAGNIVEKGPAELVLGKALHPYTQGLLRSRLGLLENTSSREKVSSEEGRQLVTISGAVPSIWDKPEGCPFHPRCPKAEEICKVNKAEFKKGYDKDHTYLCHF